MPQYAIIDDADSRMEYSGSWRALTDPVSPKTPQYNGTLQATNDPNASVSFKFHGTYIDVFGTFDTSDVTRLPNASFSITPDVVPLTHLNSTGLALVPENPWGSSHTQFFASGLLSEGDYTLTIKAEGVVQGGATFYFDFVRVQVPDNTEVERVIADNGDPQWAFRGSWSPITHNGNFLTTIHSTMNAGGTAALAFEGTDVEVYGTIVGRYTDAIPLGSFQIDDGAPKNITASDIKNEATINDGTALRQQLIFSASGLSQTTHTLFLTVPTNPTLPSSPAAPSNPVWYLDYAVYGPHTSSSNSLPAPSVNGGSSPGSGSSSSGPITGSPSPSSSPPVGAIAGGVVGGLVFIFLLVGFFLWRRHQNRKIQQTQASDRDKHLEMGPPPGVTPFIVMENGGIGETAPRDPNRMPSVHKGGARRAVLDLNAGADGESEASGSRSRSRYASLPSDSGTGSGTSHGGGTQVSAGGRTGSSRTPSRTSSSVVTSATGRRERRRERRGRVVREQDGGVRLASGSDDDLEEEDEPVEVLPPRYARYE